MIHPYFLSHAHLSQSIPGGQGPVMSHFLPLELGMGAGGGGSLPKLTFSPSISLPSSLAVSHTHTDTSFHEPLKYTKPCPHHQGLSPGRREGGAELASFLIQGFQAPDGHPRASPLKAQTTEGLPWPQASQTFPKGPEYLSCSPTLWKGRWKRANLY